MGALPQETSPGSPVQTIFPANLTSQHHVMGPFLVISPALGASGMEQRDFPMVRAVAALSEELGSIPSTHVVAHNRL